MEEGTALLHAQRVVLAASPGSDRSRFLGALLDKVFRDGISALILDRTGDLLRPFLAMGSHHAEDKPENRILVTPGRCEARQIDILSFLTLVSPSICRRHPSLMEAALGIWFEALSEWLGRDDDFPMEDFLPLLAESIVKRTAETSGLNYDRFIESVFEFQHADERIMLCKESLNRSLSKADWTLWSRGLSLEENIFYGNLSHPRQCLVDLSSLDRLGGGLVSGSIIGASMVWNLVPDAELPERRILILNGLMDPGQEVATTRSLNGLGKAGSGPHRTGCTVIGFPSLEGIPATWWKQDPLFIMDSVSLKATGQTGNADVEKHLSQKGLSEQRGRDESLTFWVWKPESGGNPLPVKITWSPDPSSPGSRESSANVRKSSRTTDELMAEVKSRKGPPPELETNLPIRYTGQQTDDPLTLFLAVHLKISFRTSANSIIVKRHLFLTPLEGEMNWIRVEPLEVHSDPIAEFQYRSVLYEPDAEFVSRALENLMNLVSDTISVSLPFSDPFQEEGRPGETGEEFRNRVEDIAEREILSEKKRIEKKFEMEMERLQERLDRSRISSEEIGAVRRFQDSLERLSSLKLRLNRLVSVPWFYSEESMREETKRMRASPSGKPSVISEEDIDSMATDMEEQIFILEQSFWNAKTDIRVKTYRASQEDMIVDDLYLAWLSIDKVQSLRGNHEMD
ncbi:MAG TPA: hypothetical protein PK014_01705 [Thermoanaerobaculia bacterium]|nr:hypothetical protein [Thermoanaerobaculia bacterium]HUM28592.1 hypothetical protein [Thermoanaerobaculia bacterium]HXK66800.1 hypothetical protein [Thermoanaerobaculia bacterium]